MRTIRYKDIMRGRGTMTRQTVTQWRWWWVMTTVTRNNERQGQRVWGERILCTTQKMTMTMREQQQSTITINNQYKDNDNDKRWQQGRGKRTSDDKEDDQEREEGVYVVRKTKLGTAREYTGYQQSSPHGMTAQEMQQGQGKMRIITPDY
jgi:hypothetical protein